VPKSALLTTNPLKTNGGRSRKNSRVQDEEKLGFMYVKKQTPEEAAAAAKSAPPKSANMFTLLANLKPDEEVRNPDDEQSHSEDEDATKLVDRKISLNKSNVTGLDFDKYNEMKPTNEIRRKITNLFHEYQELRDDAHAAQEFESIIKETGLQRFMFVGYLLNNALSMDPQGWLAISTLVIDHFWKSEKLFDGRDLMEG
jgi:hypothetical protein